MNRLEEKYKTEVVPSLMKSHNYKTVMLVPKIEKIVVNIGVGDATGNSKLLDAAVKELESFNIILIKNTFNRYLCTIFKF